MEGSRWGMSPHPHPLRQQATPPRGRGGFLNPLQPKMPSDWTAGQMAINPSRQVLKYRVLTEVYGRASWV